MNVLIIDNGSKHVDKIEQFFDGWDVKRAQFDDPSIHETPADTLAILSGGRKMAVIGHGYEYENEFEFIRNFAGPIIGICLGFEMIAHLNGDWITRLETRIEGNKTVQATVEGELLGLPEEASVYEAHRWILQSVDEPLTVLARSDDGVEAFKHASRPVYGTQFHPEISSDNDGGKILQLLVNQALSSIKT